MNQTIQNLAKAFVGESIARNRYSIYSKIARVEGYEQISAIFLKTAENERVHAKWFFTLIHEPNHAKNNNKNTIKAIDVGLSVPVTFGNTKENLKSAIEGEKYEYEELYPVFASVAEREGFGDLASRLRAIAKAEQHHAERYRKLLEQLEKGTLFKKDDEREWACRECGYVHVGKEPPAKCPSCDHAKGFYQLKCETY